jgi:hypothetical protein
MSSPVSNPEGVDQVEPNASRVGSSPMREVTAAEKLAWSAVDLLDVKTRLIRAEVNSVLAEKDVTPKRLIDVMLGHDQADVKRTLPLVMCGLINTVSKQTKMRDSMRIALKELAEKHDYTFDFNEAYQRFYRGEPPRDRIKSAAAVTDNFFRDHQPYSDFLDLGGKHASKVKELKIICELAELLNYGPTNIRDLLFRIRDARRAANSNKQGVSKFVTTDDLDTLKKELEVCKTQSSSKKRGNDSAAESGTFNVSLLIPRMYTHVDPFCAHLGPNKRGKKSNLLSNPMVDDEEDE